MFESSAVKFAIDAVRRASQLVQLVQSQMVTEALTKGDRSPVTVADFAAQALVAKLLADAFPNDQLIGEEDAVDLRNSAGAETLASVTSFVNQSIEDDARPEQVCDWIDLGSGEPKEAYWTLDPVDGTKGFLRGEQYAVALAKVEAGRVVLGVLGCPNLSDGFRVDMNGGGSLLVAEAGSGTWVASIEGGDFHQLHVSQRSEPIDARILRSVEAGHTNVDQMSVVATELGTTADPVCMDSQAKYAVLAAGAGDLLFRLLSPSRPDYREKIWDQAAGSLIVQEAGGRITDLDGRDLDFAQGRTLANNRGVVASNGLLHDAALETLKRVGA